MKIVEGDYEEWMGRGGGIHTRRACEDMGATGLGTAPVPAAAHAH